MVGSIARRPSILVSHSEDMAGIAGAGIIGEAIATGIMGVHTLITLPIRITDIMIAAEIVSMIARKIGTVSVIAIGGVTASEIEETLL